METFLWLISHFSCRLAVVLLGMLDAIMFYALHEHSELKSYVNAHLSMIITISAITLLTSIVLAFIGGKAGYEYVYMERSRHWTYRSTSFSRGDNTFKNVLYWAGKFALLPIIVLLLAILTYEIIAIL